MNMQYQIRCLERPVGSAIIFGSLFAAVDIAQGSRATPRLFAMNICGLYAYGALQCPMEGLARRQSAWHNFFSGAILGYLGVQSGYIGVPFVHPTFFVMNPRIPPAVAGAVVYGGLGATMAAFGGKPF